MKKGICVAGNMIVDILYQISKWPKQGELVHVYDGVAKSTGGAVCNTIIDLARLDPKMPLQAMGRIGKDPEGELILKNMSAYPNIDTANLVSEGSSAFTLVLNDAQTNERTFFCSLGCNKKFVEEDIDWSKLDCDIFHIGYILLLESLDQPDEEYGTKMARLLHDVQAKGIKTSIDVVSESGDRFKTLVPPSMKYADYCIINELEASASTSIPLRDEKGGLITENIEPCLRKMKEMGVKHWAVIHCPEGGYGLDENDKYVALESLHLPKGYIKGSVGAGDAFCAGVLCGAEHGDSIEQAITLGIATAAASLSEASATDGVLSAPEALELYKRLR